MAVKAELGSGGEVGHSGVLRFPARQSRRVQAGRGWAQLGVARQSARGPARMGQARLSSATAVMARWGRSGPSSDKRGTARLGRYGLPVDGPAPSIRLSSAIVIPPTGA